MLPLPIIFLILVISVYTADAHPRTAADLPAWLILATVAATHLFILTIAAQVCRRTASLLHKPETSATALLVRHDRILSMLRWTVILLAPVQLWFGGWGALVMNAPTSTSPGWNLARYYPFLIPQAVFLLAPVLTWIFIWIFEHRVDAANFSRVYPYNLARGIPSHPPPPIPQYLALKIRLTFFLFVPIALVTVVSGISDLYMSTNQWLPWLTGLGSLLILLIISPWLLTRLWSTTPMTGPLRAGLETAAAGHRIPFTNILIWRTHFAVKNAAIVGYLPFARYFLMTDSLLESLTDDQIESVFAHELGHARRRHIWLLMVTLVSASLAAGALSAFASPLFDHIPAWTRLDPDDIAGLFQLFLIALLIFFCLGPVSRRFEFEADFFAAQHMSSLTPSTPAPTLYPSPTLVPHPHPHLNPNPTPSPSLSASPSPSLSPGVTLFSSALLTLISLTNRDPAHGNWTHPSPNRRVAFLDSLAADPSLIPAYARRCRTTRLLIFLFFLISASLTTAAFFFARFNDML